MVVQCHVPEPREYRLDPCVPRAAEDPTSAGKLVIRFHIDFPQQISAEAGDALEVGN